MQRSHHLTPSLLLLLLSASGCGQSEPFALVPVSGKVAYEDGTLIEADYITITFDPLAEAIDAKTHARPAEANVNVAEGTFQETTTRKYGDGVAAGKHKVLIRAFDAEMNPIDAIPQRYTDKATTPLEVHTDDAPFEFKVATE